MPNNQIKETQGDNRVQELTPGIQTAKETRDLGDLGDHLKNEELFYRAIGK